MRKEPLPPRMIVILSNKEFTSPDRCRSFPSEKIRISVRPGLKRIFLFILFCWSFTFGFGQPSDAVKNIYEILNRRDNTSLIRKVEELTEKGLYYTYSNLEELDELVRYAENRPDIQGKVLVLLLVNNSRIRDYRVDYSEEEIDRAMMMARMSNDKYVLANAYWIYGRIKRYLGQFEPMLVHYNAAFELYKELGVAEWEYVNNIDFDISIGFYHRYDYRKSVDYSLKCYRRMYDENSKIKGLDKLFLMDMLGAGYMGLEMPDSSVFFYERLLSVLADEQEAFDDHAKDLWTTIAEGRIGESYLDLGELSRAAPLITRYYEGSIRLNDSLNILLSGNAYAKLLYQSGEPHETLLLWKKALKQSKKKEQDHLSEKSCRGIAGVYRDEKNIDSMLYYLAQADEFRRTIDQKKYISSQDVIKQKYEFMRLTSSVRSLSTRVTYLKNSRNYAILIILLTFGSVYLFQRKRAYKLKYRSEAERAKKELAQQELNMSLDQLMILKDNLNERNTLARQLIERIRKLEQTKDTSQLVSEINDYILNSPEGWEKFKSAFLKIHPHFLYNLEGKCTGLTAAEIRLSLLLYLKLDNSEIGNLLGISAASVSRSKSRLKQKLELKTSDSLNEFIAAL